MTAGVRPLVLVADDDADLCRVLQERLGKDGFEVRSALDGQAAIDAVGERRPDLILLDLILPVLNGIQVCSRLRQDHATRDIPILFLSARKDQEIVREAVRLGAAGFLIKPVRYETLRSKTDRILEIGSKEDRTSSIPLPAWVRFADDEEADRVRRLIREAARVEDLPAIPAVVTKVLETVQSPSAGARQMAAAIELDPAIAAQVLRVANSAFFGQPGKVTDLARAVILIGFAEVANIAMTVSVLKMLEGRRCPGIEPMPFWEHALGTAVLAERIGEEVGHQPAGELLVAGLLHDVGKLVLSVTHPNDYRKVIERSRQVWVHLRDLEREAFGENHAFVGGVLARKWGLPEPIEFAITHHHRPMSVEGEDSRHVQIVRIVHLADAIAKAAGFGNGGDPLVEEGNRRLWSLLHLERKRWNAILRAARKEVAGFKEALGLGREGPPLPPSAAPALVVDDRDREVSTVALVLEAGGIPVRRAGDWNEIHEGLESEDGEPPVCIVLDAEGPADRSRYYETLRKGKATAHLPMVYLAPEPHASAVRGAHGVTPIPKPFLPDYLVETVRNIG